MSNLNIRQVAVLGAGVMGAQIAAHLINANIPVILYDLPDKNNANPNKLVADAVNRLKKLKPAPLGLVDKANNIRIANFQDDLSLLQSCNLIIEVISEQFQLKQNLYKTITPYINKQAILATNTSGLSVNNLAAILPEELRPRFCGMHFFNPPRYLPLVELTTNTVSCENTIADLEAFIVSNLGKGVIYTKDTPNFIANRVGIFSILSIIYHAKKFNLSFDLVDALTGTLIGRPKSATFRTCDVVGLDTMAHVISTMIEHLADDPWFALFTIPNWLSQLIEQGNLGQKTGCGIYKKQGDTILVLDVATMNYQPAVAKPSDEIMSILKIRDPAEKFKQLRESNCSQAKFLWCYYRDLFHYSAYHLATIAESVRDVDLAMRWGFGWQQGPFELWQSAGWQTVSQAIVKEINAKQTPAVVAISDYDNLDGVYNKNGLAYTPSVKDFRARSSLVVYKRQLFPDPVLNETFDEGETIFENSAIRLWHQKDKIGILSFKTKANTINELVLDGIRDALSVAEKECKAMVLWQRQGKHFSVGFDLTSAGNVSTKEGEQQLLNVITKFQQTSSAIRYSLVPVVAAVKGYVFGGGCELMLHCDQIVAGYESYIGLVETGVGLIPAGGGCKEFAQRAAKYNPQDPYFQLKQYFKQIALAEFSSCAEDAKQKHFMQPQDVIVLNDYELLYVAKQQALALSESAYRPVLPTLFPVAGNAGYANLQSLLINYVEGKFISEHDFNVASKLAFILCGGDVAANSLVDEEWLFKLERDMFMQLIKTEKTQQRITHTLKTGKSLKN